MHVLKSKKEQITLEYGKQTLNGAPYNHAGIDLVKYRNQLDDIIAAQKGKVVGVRKDVKGFVNGSYGNYVKLQHEDGYETLYAHLAYGSVKLNVGDVVDAGEVLGSMGATGMAYGAHLHFEVRKNGKTVDPKPFLDDEKKIPAYEEQLSPIVPRGWVDYKVKAGDTLSEIALERDTTPEEIQKYNPIIEDINLIRVGWIIQVPPIKDGKVEVLKAGDMVIVNGVGYAASDGSGAQTKPRTEELMKLVKIIDGAKYPYACNQNKNMNGVTAYWKNVRKA